MTGKAAPPKIDGEEEEESAETIAKRNELRIALAQRLKQDLIKSEQEKMKKMQVGSDSLFLMGHIPCLIQISYSLPTYRKSNNFVDWTKN